MKNIAILVNTLESGGAEKQSIYLLNALSDNYKIYLIVFYGKHVEEKLIKLIKNENNSLLKLEGNSLIKIFRLYKIFKTGKITHMFTYLTKPNFYGAIIGRFSGIGHIYTNIRTSKLPYWKIFLEKISSNYFSTATIFNSYAGETIFKGKGIKNGVVIPNCFPDISNAFRREQKEIIKIITVGRFVEEKDYFTAIRAIKELRETRDNFVFQIVGYGKLENAIRKIISELCLGKNVEVFINPNNITELLNDADIYLSTSLFEGTSNSIMEAMNACLPIVATNVGDNGRLISGGVNGFLHTVGDYAAIAESIKLLIDDYKKRITFGLASHKILCENYSYNIFKYRYLQLMEKG